MNIGITGQNGFIGYHLSQTIKYKLNNHDLIPFKRSFFDDANALNKFVKSCDVIIHLAGINRAENDKVVYNSNININKRLNESLLNSEFSGHLIFASSFQEENNSGYGESKKESRIFLEETINKLGGNFTGILIPNVFGPFCKPNYNSFIATFCDIILKDNKPEIIDNNDVKLIYIDDLINEIIQIVINGKALIKKYIESKIEIKVTEVIDILEIFKDLYIYKNSIPSLDSNFKLQLFNTFRSYINLNDNYPKMLKENSDPRGTFTELIRSEIGGQYSFSITSPGKTRGNHFHTRKIERFIVLDGEAKISLRKIGSDKVYSFILNGNKPSYVDMPVWFTHNITNIGNTPLITSFWINEPYNGDDADTYFENV
ncbi:NAD-dependent epimerase/dehydratase family protein [Flavobacteriaceae bacterium]|nr:NAD-dependent epimerase/dehydratase family protein [Flavobacteriaceae bacterium]MDC3297672.1 NAD-dependent epimerase/dehydratase family protein [Flavobacteriaceae bacterium]